MQQNGQTMDWLSGRGYDAWVTEGAWHHCAECGVDWCDADGGCICDDGPPAPLWFFGWQCAQAFIKAAAYAERAYAQAHAAAHDRSGSLVALGRVLDADTIVDEITEEFRMRVPTELRY